MNRAVVLTNQRRAERDEVFYRTTVGIGARPPARALVVDISPLGCMVRCDAPAERGQPMTIILPGLGTVQGSVAWSVMGRIGMEFATSLAQDPYDSLLNILRTP